MGLLDVQDLPLIPPARRTSWIALVRPHHDSRCRRTVLGGSLCLRDDADRRLRGPGVRCATLKIRERLSRQFENRLKRDSQHDLDGRFVLPKNVVESRLERLELLRGADEGEL